MTPAQQSALEALVGRPLSAGEISLTISRSDTELAVSLSAGRMTTTSLAVEDVFDVLFESGDYLSIKTAQLQGNPAAAMAFAVLQDAKTLGPGKVNVFAPATVALFDQLQAATLLSQPGRDALTARSTVANPVRVDRVSEILNSEG